MEDRSRRGKVEDRVHKGWLNYNCNLIGMSGIEDEQVELSSESDPEDIDLDLLNEIKV